MQPASIKPGTAPIARESREHSSSSFFAPVRYSALELVLKKDKRQSDPHSMMARRCNTARTSRLAIFSCRCSIRWSAARISETRSEEPTPELSLGLRRLASGLTPLPLIRPRSSSSSLRRGWIFGGFALTSIGVVIVSLHPSAQNFSLNFRCMCLEDTDGHRRITCSDPAKQFVGVVPRSKLALINSKAKLNLLSGGNCNCVALHLLKDLLLLYLVATFVQQECLQLMRGLAVGPPTCERHFEFSCFAIVVKHL